MEGTRIDQEHANGRDRFFGPHGDCATAGGDEGRDDNASCEIRRHPCLPFHCGGVISVAGHMLTHLVGRTEHEYLHYYAFLTVEAWRMYLMI